MGTGKRAACSLNVGKAAGGLTIAGKGNAETVAAGKTLQMNVAWTDGKPNNPEVAWEVTTPENASKIATISGKGVLTAISEGTVRVKATSMANPKETAERDITVYVPVKSVSLNTTTGTVSRGEGAKGLQLSVQVVSAIEGHRATGVTLGSAPKVTYAVDKEYEKYHSVDEETGIVTAGGTAGKNIPVTATVTAYNGYRKVLTCKVNVKDSNALKGISINRKKLSLGEGNIAVLTAALSPLNPDGEEGMTWESSNEAVATVDQSGKVTGVKAGSATITVRADGTVTKKGKPVHPAASCKVTVKPSITAIAFTNAKALEDKKLGTGKTYTIKTKLTLSGPGKAASTALLWESSDPSVATVSQKGVVKALRPGTVTITAKAKDNKAEGAQRPSPASVTFETYAAVSSIRLDRKTLTVGTNKESLYGVVRTARVLPENVTDPSIKWTASNGNIALAAVTAGTDPRTGSFADAGAGVTTKAGEALAVKALKPGTAKLTGMTTDGSKKKVTCTVTVHGEVTGLRLKESKGKKGLNDVTPATSESPLGGLERDPDGKTGKNIVKYTSNMKAGSSMTLTPVIEINGADSSKKAYKTYKKYTDTSVSYRSSDTDVATVNKSGKIAIKKGTGGKKVTIYAASADGKQTAQITITVK